MENTARTIGMRNFGIWDSFEKLVISKTSNDLETSPANFWKKGSSNTSYDFTGR